MVLWFVGLGLAGPEDITIKGLDVIRGSDVLYLESYTSILPGFDRERLAEHYRVKSIVEADRELVESGCEAIISAAKTQNVAFLVVGDPLCATTHADLWARARREGVEVRVVHNASVMSAISVCGLQLYRFGETVSIPFWTSGWRPASFYDKIAANFRSGLHTLCLLDIKVKEQSEENLMRGRAVYEPPRFMTVAQALGQLMEVEAERQLGIATGSSAAVAVARLGSEDQAIAFGSCSELLLEDLGAPLHSLVICGPSLHEVEREVLEGHRASRSRGPPPCDRRGLGSG